MLLKAYYMLCDSKLSSFFHDVYSAPEMKYPSTWNNGEDIESLDWTFVSVSINDSCIVSARWMCFSSWDWTA